MNNQDALKKALNEIYLNNSRELINSGAEKWVYTKEYHYEDKMQKLIAKQKSSYWQYTNTAAKRLLIAAAVLIAILSSAMTVPAVREPVIEFVITKYEEFSSYFAKDTGNPQFPEEIEKVYMPQYMPDGFELSDTVSHNTANTVIWKNYTTNETIMLVQNLVYLQSNLNTENVQTTEFLIDDLKIVTYSNNGESVYLWNNHNYSFILMADDSFDFSEIKKIIISL